MTASVLLSDGPAESSSELSLKVEPRTPSTELQKDARFEDSVLVTRFGPTPGRQLFVVVNLDYRKDRQLTVEALFPLARFDATAGKWLSADGKRLALHLPRGGGVLLREAGQQPYSVHRGVL